MRGLSAFCHFEGENYISIIMQDWKTSVVAVQLGALIAVKGPRIWF
jgi:hypothetical protein